MTVAFIISIAINAVLAVVVIIQRVRSSVTTQAVNDLVSRMAKLEETIQRLPGKVSIVQEKQ